MLCPVGNGHTSSFTLRNTADVRFLSSPWLKVPVSLVWYHHSKEDKQVFIQDIMKNAFFHICKKID